MTNPPRKSLEDLESDTARRLRDREGASAGRRSRVVTALAVLAVLAVLAGGGTALWKGTHITPPAGANAGAGPGTVGPLSTGVTVVMDGWSVQNLGGELSYTADDGAPAPVGLVPATASDVAEIAATTPKILTQVAARTITSDVTLSCSGAGCKTATATYPLTAFTNPAATPLGRSYTGYAIPSLLYVAKLPVAKSVTSVTLVTPGGAALSLDLGSSSGPKTTGYGLGRHLVAAGLGQLFSPMASWVGTSAANPTMFIAFQPSGQPLNQPANQSADDAAIAAALAALDTLHEPAPPLLSFAGLAVPLKTANTWTPDRLTYATSPTTGCGSNALCVPGKVNTLVVSSAVDAATVCSDSTHAIARLQDTVVSATLPAPTNQFISDTPRWGAPPTLLTGKQTLRFSVLALIDDQAGDNVGAGGRVLQGAGSPSTFADALAGVRFSGVTYTVC